MEQQQDNLESLVAAFNGTLNKEWQFVNDYPWKDKGTVKDRSDAYSLHYLITSKRIDTAEKIVKLAGKEGKGGRKDVSKVNREAKKFFEFFKEACEQYIGQADYVTLVEEGGNVAAEINFQTEISHKLFTLQSKMKGISDSTKESKVSVSLFGDVNIPILLRDIAEQEFPEIKSYLNERRETNT
jgi:hypothetical protein